LVRRRPQIQNNGSKAEIAFGYSFINVHPNLSPITSYNINGGGAGFVFNATPLFGIKAEFMDYTAAAVRN